MSFRFPWRLSKPGLKGSPSMLSSPDSNQAESDDQRGVDCENGTKTTPDDGQAAHCYAQAAERNSAPAQLSLSRICRCNSKPQRGVQRDILLLMTTLIPMGAD